ncbi:3-octaprenyl-4-hydroxybenzoate carboxy-lyase [Pandoraea iniqua]|uniref:3-octaprenyl-4-hydroxybenzoate carboxy-lyase n=1 Tax=Pandoraea iniqua TaxID=2508288 RepID=A0A5E4U628_9BURK|nr:UbiD family decarboxylase [Pandoraea iniqua]VVD93639.1 3-octaprenyl-4-hydroxybenzoate carboxy-lyase [Pandoraea iniqua]
MHPLHAPAAANGSTDRNPDDAQSMRPFIAALAQRGELLRVGEPVDPQFEISAWLAQLAEGPAVQFDSVTGHAQAAIGNLLNSVERIALGLGISRTDMQQRIVSAIEQGIAPQQVAHGACQETVIHTPDLRREVPAPLFFPRETGPYITAGVIFTRDSRTGKGNVSFARVKLLDGNRGMVGIAPNHHLAVMAREAKARGETLPIAVTVGNHPAVLIAAALYLRLGDDELDCAGALLGEPVRTVACKTIPLDVPAACEWVLEGTLDIDEQHDEKLVSEFHGMYEPYGSGPVATFHCLTRRNDALFQIIEPGYYPEHTLIGGVAIAAGLARTLRAVAIPVREVAVGHGGCGRLNAVVSLSAHRAGDAQKAMFALWGSVNLIKNITVVDDDVDPWNASQVEWAVATRMRPDRDMLVIPGGRTDRSEPIKQDGVATKLGLNATRRACDRPDWTRAVPPPDVMEKVAQRIAAQPLANG